MKIHVIQNKNGVMRNIGVSVKSQMIGVLAKMIICGILVRVMLRVINHVKLY